MSSICFGSSPGSSGLGSVGFSAGSFSLFASWDEVRSSGDEGSGESNRLSKVGGGGGGGGRLGMGNSLCAIYE